jgi:hypothetical protein
VSTPSRHVHPATQLVTPEGYPADIDNVLVPLITALWAAGFTIIGSCQDLGESIGDAWPRKAAYWKGWVLLELREAGSCRLADLAAGQFPMHWTQEGAWELTIPVIVLPFGTLPMDVVQVHFPATQLDDLTALIRKEAP